MYLHRSFSWHYLTKIVIIPSPPPRNGRGGRNISSITIINIPLFLSEVMHKWAGVWLMNLHSKTLLFNCFQQFFTLYPSKHYFLLCNGTIKKFYTSSQWERGQVSQKMTRKLWEREIKPLGGRGGAAGWGCGVGRAGLRKGGEASTSEGLAHNVFLPSESARPFCACAVRFKLRSARRAAGRAG